MLILRMHTCVSSNFFTTFVGLDGTVAGRGPWRRTRPGVNAAHDQAVSVQGKQARTAATTRALPPGIPCGAITTTCVLDAVG